MTSTFTESALDPGAACANIARTAAAGEPETMEDLTREFQNLGPTLFPTRERAPAGAGSGGLMVIFMLPGAATGSVTVKVTVKTPVKTPVETPPETPDAILHLLRAEPSLSVRELASHIGRSKRAVERAIVKLRESGRLERIGPAKGGHWRVIA